MRERETFRKKRENKRKGKHLALDGSGAPFRSSTFLGSWPLEGMAQQGCERGSPAVASYFTYCGI